jgi:hypothetical protein
MSPRAYSLCIVAGALVLLAPVLALNLMLIANDTRHDKNRLASAWQQETGGVTYAPPISNNRPFKTLRLADRLPHIDTVVFGSSTMLTLGADLLPGHMRAYNFAQTGNPLRSVIGEARYLVNHEHERVRRLIIPIDWAIGFVFDDGAAPETDLSAARVPPPAVPGLGTRLREALSLPRITVLGTVLRDIVRAPDPRAMARRLFTGVVDEPYRCADGSLARDYDPVFRGRCVGFRADGTATFADQKRVTEDAAAAVLARAASASSQYAQSLDKTGGQPGTLLLEDLSRLLGQARARGIEVILIMPPLLPQLDARLAASAHSGAKLARTKAALAAWARDQGVSIIDAGPSERYGCTATEFIDGHHALPPCYRKITARLFAGRPASP